MLIRNASSEDIPAIMTVLEQLSDEIPVKMDTEKGWNVLRDTVAACCEQGSWVTLNETGHVVGFLLVKKYANPGMMRDGDGRYNQRPECEFDGLNLPYGGVLKGYREQGRFSNLLSQAKALKSPLQVDVSCDNKCGMAARLVKAGFVKKPCSLFPNSDYFIWTPSEQP